MRALIAGLGLIGGSIGIALRARGWHVMYLDPHVEVEDARRAGAADERVASLESSQVVDVAIVATPVDVALTLLGDAAEIPGDVPEGGQRGAAFAGTTTITTACSVMAPFAHGRVVSGHPLAGSQERSLAAARGDLFDGKRWFIHRDDAAVERLIHDCGATPERVDPTEHDRAVAMTSHLPQVLSTALAASIDESMLRFAGSGLQTFLRLAGSDAGVWSSVITANRDNILGQAGPFLTTVNAILAGDVEAFARAQQLVKKMKDDEKDEG